MARKKTHPKNTRPRGAASCPCPGCRGNSRVLITQRIETGTRPRQTAAVVSRLRECLDGKCGRRFYTHEKAVK